MKNIHNVLIVEDSRVHLEKIKDLFSQMKQVNAELHPVKTIIEARRVIKDEVIDLVILDLNLEHTKGLESLHGISGLTTYIPVIVLTGIEDDDFAIKTLSEGASDYLFKSELEPILFERSIRYAVTYIRQNKKAEAELRKSEQKYKSLFESNRDAILVANKNREITDANLAFENLFGYKLGEIKGKTTDYVYFSKKDYFEIGDKLKKLNNTSGFLEIIKYKKKDGTVFSGETNVFYLKNDKNEITDFVGIIS